MGSTFLDEKLFYALSELVVKLHCSQQAEYCVEAVIVLLVFYNGQGQLFFLDNLVYELRQLIACAPRVANKQIFDAVVHGLRRLQEGELNIIHILVVFLPDRLREVNNILLLLLLLLFGFLLVCSQLGLLDGVLVLLLPLLLLFLSLLLLLGALHIDYFQGYYSRSIAMGLWESTP